jgi:hypothetical protein
MTTGRRSDRFSMNTDVAFMDVKWPMVEKNCAGGTISDSWLW